MPVALTRPNGHGYPELLRNGPTPHAGRQHEHITVDMPTAAGDHATDLVTRAPERLDAGVLVDFDAQLGAALHQTARE